MLTPGAHTSISGPLFENVAGTFDLSVAPTAIPFGVHPG